MEKKLDLSVVVTAHSESVLIHKTLKSVFRALKKINNKYSYEIILHLDKPDNKTNDYIKQNSDFLKNIKILNNSFGDLALSRNYAIKQACGKYIATIDADDLMSENWLLFALKELKKAKTPSVAHAEIISEFEDSKSIITRTGSLEKSTDTLLSTLGNRWNSVIVAPRKILIEIPYRSNSEGYGYEDWGLNNDLIFNGIKNLTIKNTAIFVRRRFFGTEWQRQKINMLVLKSNKLLSFENIKKTRSYIKAQTQASKYGFIKKMAKLLMRISHGLNINQLTATINQYIYNDKLKHIPEWLIQEMSTINKIDTNIFPSKDYIKDIAIYNPISPSHIIAGNLYKELVDKLKFNNYDYIIFAPWIISGGADKYTIDYSNTICELKKDKRVLIICTMPINTPTEIILNDRVDMLNFGYITRNASFEIKNRLLEHLVENSGANFLHILNSELGYDFINSHKQYIAASDKKIILTAFSQSIDNTGRLYGYSHTHVPKVYDLADLIISDNQALLNMWQSDYGFDRNKMVVLRPKIDINDKDRIPINTSSKRILWASRLAPEKMIEMLPSIAKQLEGDGIKIDIYGTGDKKYLNNCLKDKPKNLNYCGEFNNFFNLPLKNYALLLYTSKFDGMPNILLEAASVGMPLVASNVGGISELITHNKTGLLIDDINSPDKYSEAILSLINSPKLTEKLINNLHKELSKNFSYASYRANLNKIIERLSF